MAYCTIDDVVHELHPTLLHQMRLHYDGENALDFNTNLEEHIAKAQAHADASLARAYSVPLRQATKVVTSAVCKIAAYFSVAAFAETEDVLRDRYETGNLILDNLVKANDAALVDEAAKDDEPKNSWVRWGSDKRIFTDRELQKW